MTMINFLKSHRALLNMTTAAILTVGVVFTAGMQPARAQFGGIGPSATNPSSLQQGGPRIEGPSSANKKPEPPPDALPGAAPRADRVAPVQGAPIANPTEALFDAINRGDIASARDAIDRGADLDGPGILGMTPIDLSIDLARNDITFLLLSLRAGDGRPARHPPSQEAQATAGGKSAAGHPATPAPTKTAVRPPATPAKGPVPTTPVAATVVAGDSGAPNPTAGFLGFGGGRSATQ
jgi:hypothetical protein